MASMWWIENTKVPISLLVLLTLMFLVNSYNYRVSNEQEFEDLTNTNFERALAYYDINIHNHIWAKLKDWPSSFLIPLYLLTKCFICIFCDELISFFIIIDYDILFEVCDTVSFLLFINIERKNILYSRRLHKVFMFGSIQIKLSLLLSLSSNQNHTDSITSIVITSAKGKQRSMNQRITETALNNSTESPSYNNVHPYRVKFPIFQNHVYSTSSTVKPTITAKTTQPAYPGTVVRSASPRPIDPSPQQCVQFDRTFWLHNYPLRWER